MLARLFDDRPVADPEIRTPRRPMDRIARREWEAFPSERIRRVRSAVVFWDGQAWRPAWVVAWVQVYAEWFVRLRIRRDVWRDREDWYLYRADALLPVQPDDRDVRDWLPKRPLN